MSEGGTALTKGDFRTIEEMFGLVVERIRAGDWAAWASMYADDAVFQAPHAPAARGRATILQWGSGLGRVEAFDFSDIRVAGEGNLAYATSAYSLKLEGLPEDRGKQLVVCRRGADGWKVAAVSINSDLPVPGPA